MPLSSTAQLLTFPGFRSGSSALLKGDIDSEQTGQTDFSLPPPLEHFLTEQGITPEQSFEEFLEQRERETGEEGRSSGHLGNMQLRRKINSLNPRADLELELELDHMEWRLQLFLSLLKQQANNPTMSPGLLRSTASSLLNSLKKLAPKLQKSGLKGQRFEAAQESLGQSMRMAREIHRRLKPHTAQQQATPTQTFNPRFDLTPQLRPRWAAQSGG